MEELLVDEVGGGEAGDDGGLPVGLEVVVGVGGCVGFGDTEEVICGCVRACFLGKMSWMGMSLTLEFAVDFVIIVCRWRGRDEDLEDYVGSALTDKGDLALIRRRKGCDVHFALLCCRRPLFRSVDVDDHLGS